MEIYLGELNMGGESGKMLSFMLTDASYDDLTEILHHSDKASYSLVQSVKQ